jgi:hypothetical protein
MIPFTQAPKHNVFVSLRSLSLMRVERRTMTDRVNIRTLVPTGAPLDLSKRGTAVTDRDELAGGFATN